MAQEPEPRWTQPALSPRHQSSRPSGPFSAAGIQYSAAGPEDRYHVGHTPRDAVQDLVHIVSQSCHRYWSLDMEEAPPLQKGLDLGVAATWLD